MEVVVDELWTRTVARMPIIRPATGLLRILFEEKASPAAFPPSNRKALLRKSNEQMKRYRRPRRRTTLPTARPTRRTFPKPSSSVGAQSKIRYERGKTTSINQNTIKRRAKNIKYSQNLPDHFGPRSWSSGKAHGSNSSSFPSSSCIRVPASSAGKNALLYSCEMKRLIRIFNIRREAKDSDNVIKVSAKKQCFVKFETYRRIRL